MDRNIPSLRSLSFSLLSLVSSGCRGPPESGQKDRNPYLLPGALSRRRRIVDLFHSLIQEGCLEAFLCVGTVVEVKSSHSGEKWESWRSWHSSICTQQPSVVQTPLNSVVSTRVILWTAPGAQVSGVDFTWPPDHHTQSRWTERHNKFRRVKERIEDRPTRKVITFTPWLQRLLITSWWKGRLSEGKTKRIRQFTIYKYWWIRTT